MSLPSRIDPFEKASDDDIDGALEALDCLGSRETESADIKVDAFHVALEGGTRHGLAQAVRRILQGSLKHPFFPNPVELRMEHDAVMAPFHEAEERRARQQRLDEERQEFTVRVRRDGERERIAECYRRWQEDMQGEGQRIDLDAIRRKYDPAQLASIPDREPSASDRFERRGWQP